MPIVQNRTQLLYFEGPLTAIFSDNSYNLQGYSASKLKIIAIGGDVEFSLTGGNSSDGKIIAGESETFDISFCKLALKGSATAARVWAYC